MRPACPRCGKRYYRIDRSAPVEVLVCRRCGARYRRSGDAWPSVVAPSFLPRALRNIVAGAVELVQDAAAEVKHGEGPHRERVRRVLARFVAREVKRWTS